MTSSLDMKYITELVHQAQMGDSNAFAELYIATYEKLYRFSCRYLKDHYMAQDALQETYIKALQHLNQLRDPTLIIPWLGQINLRICYRIQHQNAACEPVDDGTLNSNHRPRDEEDPENVVVNIDYNEYLMKQILNLPFTESQVLLLRFYHNMKEREIADLMEISVSTVKRSITTGISRLKNSVNP